jgi:hypothetical protein
VKGSSEGALNVLSKLGISKSRQVVGLLGMLQAVMVSTRRWKMMRITKRMMTPF